MKRDILDHIILYWSNLPDSELIGESSFEPNKRNI